jgi:hypothetical protein
MPTAKRTGKARPICHVPAKGVKDFLGFLQQAWEVFFSGGNVTIPDS